MFSYFIELVLQLKYQHCYFELYMRSSNKYFYFLPLQYY